MLRTPLHVAVLSADTQRVQAVLSGPPFDLNKRDLVCLFVIFAVPAPDERTVRASLRARAVIHCLGACALLQLGGTALYTAAKLGYVDILNVLIEAGADVSLQDKVRDCAC